MLNREGTCGCLCACSRTGHVPLVRDLVSDCRRGGRASRVSGVQAPAVTSAFAPK